METVLEFEDNFKRYQSIKSILQFGMYSTFHKPVVSIVMPVYNSPKYFEKAILSAVNQDYEENYEIVVVDNNDDKTIEKTVFLEIILKIRNDKIFYYRNEKNIGALGNFNRCIELARAPFLTYLHDDDVLLPSALSRLMALQKKYGNRAIFSAFNEIDENDQVIRQNSWGKRSLKIFSYKDSFLMSLWDLLESNPTNGGGSLFSTEKLKSLGGHNLKFDPTSDYALNVLYTFHFGSVMNTVPTMNYRWANNTTYLVYDKMKYTSRSIRNGMINNIFLPNPFLRLIIDAYFRSRTQYILDNSTPRKDMRPLNDKLMTGMVHCLLVLSHIFRGNLRLINILSDST